MTDNDRELLEMAARAAGIEIVWRRHSDAYYYDDEESGREQWVPLDDDRQALRLAVKLRLLSPTIDPLIATAALDVRDPCAATRRAIVRAAAAIGGSMK